MPRAMAQGVIRIAERTETVAALVTVWAAADTAVRIASATGACADGAVTAASSHGQSIANRTLVETVIPAMAEEAFSILRGYAVESGPERVFESLDGAGCDTAQV
jgi:hypothetical protein